MFKNSRPVGARRFLVSLVCWLFDVVFAKDLQVMLLVRVRIGLA